MATTQEVREELERLNRARADAVAELAGPLGADRSGALHAALIVIVDYWREEATIAAEEKKRGWKSRGSQLEDAATLLAGFAGGLLSSELTTHITVNMDGSIVQNVDMGDTPAGTILAPALDDDLESWRSVVRECKILGHACRYDDATDEWHPTVPVTSGPCSTAGCQPGDVIPQAVSGPAGASLELMRYGVSPVMELVTPAGPPPRLTWEQLRAAGRRIAAEREHVSYSTITSLAQCGVAWLIDHDAELGREIPAWWNVAGTAFHAYTAALESEIPGTPTQQAWAEFLEVAADDASRESGGVAPASFRAAKGGLENREWWLVEGFAMLEAWTRHYLGSSQFRVASDAAGNRAIELPFELELDGVTLVGELDRVYWDNLNMRYWVPDLKTGGTRPDDALQLGIAAHAWAMLASSKPLGPEAKMAGGFYMARAGSHDLEVDDLRAAYPLDHLTYLAHAAMAQIKAGMFLPRVSTKGLGCGSCGHRSICPALS